MLESLRGDSFYKKLGLFKFFFNVRYMERFYYLDRYVFFFWKDIYREIRGKGVDSDREIEDNEEEVILIRRFLEEDFMLIFFMLRQLLFEEIRFILKKYFDLFFLEFLRGGVYSSFMFVLRKSNIFQVCIL